MEGPVEGPGSILSGLARLQHLTALTLQPPHRLVWPPPGPSYSALTASTKLRTLHLYETNFPAGVWLHVFPAGRMLPHMTRLTISDNDHMADIEVPSAWGAVDMSRLVSCCPNLCKVDSIVLQPDLHVSMLQKLAGLTHLAAYQSSSSSQAMAEALKGLAVITQLRKLEVFLILEQPTEAMLPLTTLTGLTYLRCGPKWSQLRLTSVQVCRLAETAMTRYYMMWQFRQIATIHAAIKHESG